MEKRKQIPWNKGLKGKEYLKHFKGNKMYHAGNKLPQISREKHYNWKGGKIIQNGYKYILKPEHPKAKSKKGYVAEHVLVVEDYLGRILKEEVVHHIDGDKLNNEIKNLKLFKNNTEHIKFHKNDIKRGFIKWIIKKLFIGLKRIIF